MALVKTYIPIASFVLPSSNSIIDIGSLPSTYKDLVIEIAGTGGGVVPLIRFNGDSGSNYKWIEVGRDNPVYNSYSTSDTAINVMNAYAWSSGVAGALTINVSNYSSPNTPKPVLTTMMYETGGPIDVGGHWTSTAPITSIRVTTGSGNFPAGLKVTVYGIHG